MLWLINYNHYYLVIMYNSIQNNYNHHGNGSSWGAFRVDSNKTYCSDRLGVLFVVIIVDVCYYYYCLLYFHFYDCICKYRKDVYYYCCCCYHCMFVWLFCKKRISNIVFVVRCLQHRCNTMTDVDLFPGSSLLLLSTRILSSCSVRKAYLESNHHCLNTTEQQKALV